MYLITRVQFANTMSHLRLTPNHLYSVGGRGIEPEDVLHPSPREAEGAAVATRVDLFNTTVAAIGRITQLFEYSPIRVWELRTGEVAALRRGQPTAWSFGVRHVIAAGFRMLEPIGTAEVEYLDCDGDGEIDGATVPGVAELLARAEEENPPDARARVSAVLAIPEELRTDCVEGPEGEWVIAGNYDYNRGEVLPAPLFVNPELLVDLSSPLPPVVDSFVPEVEVYREQFVPAAEIIPPASLVTLRAVSPPAWWEGGESMCPAVPPQLWVRHGLNMLSALAKCVAADLEVDLCAGGIAQAVVSRLRADLALDESVRVYPEPVIRLGTRLGHYEAYIELTGR